MGEMIWSWLICLTEVLDVSNKFLISSGFHYLKWTANVGKKIVYFLYNQNLIVLILILVNISGIILFE